MKSKKILWMEDQIGDLETYKSKLFRSGCLIDIVPTVSDAIEKLRENRYSAVIFDIRVLPGHLPEWIARDKEKREKKKGIASHLGLELLYSLFKPEDANVKLSPPIKLDPRRMIVFSVATDVFDEIIDMGVPTQQLISKSNSDISTLLELIENIHEEI